MNTCYRNDLKLGAIVVLDSLSRSIDFEFKRSSVRGTGSSFQTFGTSYHLANKTDYYVFYENYVDSIKLHNISHKI